RCSSPPAESLFQQSGSCQPTPAGVDRGRGGDVIDRERRKAERADECAAGGVDEIDRNGACTPRSERHNRTPLRSELTSSFLVTRRSDGVLDQGSDLREGGDAQAVGYHAKVPSSGM